MKRNISDADYEGIVAGLRRLAKSDPTFKDYDFDGAGLTSILRLLALQGNQQAFTNNMLFNEGFLKTAEMRENAGSVASFLSYVPGSKRCAELYVDVTVVPYSGVTPPLEITMKTNDGFLGVKDGQTFNFMPAENVTARLENGSYLFKNVRLIQGVWATNTFTVNGAAIDSYVIPNIDIDIETLDVGVLDNDNTQVAETYNRYRSAYDLGRENKLFFLQLNRENKYEIEFGDGVFSKKLDDQNVIVVNYLLTKGIEGNGIPSVIPASSIGGFPNVSVVGKLPSTGGANEETVESIQHTAPLSVGRNGSAVTDGDYVVKAKEFYPSASVTSWGGEVNIPPRHGYTFVAIKGADGKNLSTQAKATLKENLRQYNVGSVTPLIVDAEDYFINVTSQVFWNPAVTNARSPAMRTKVIKQLRSWSKSNLEKFNTKFDKGALTSFITDVDGSIRTNVTDVTYEKRYTVDNISNQPPKTVNFHKDLKAGSVRVKGFTMSPVDPEIVAVYTYYASDADSDGNIYIYEDKSGVTRRYSGTPIGKVDYVTGLIHINPTNFNTVSEYVSVSVEAATINQNLDSVRGQIIQLNELNITMVVG
ncbi:hypothetical protein MYOV003v1_p0124 [Vibrio phage 207E48.1]|nr:hypothetical protein MYOV003v1_p0124 [Vibrio phage 207E48.1]